MSSELTSEMNNSAVVAENPPCPETETESARNKSFEQDEAKVHNEGPDIVITSASPSQKADKNNPNKKGPASLKHLRITSKQCVDQVLSRRLLAEGPDGDSRKLAHLSKRVQNFFSVCIDPSQSLEDVDARFKEVVGLIHQVKHAGLKDAEVIRNADKDEVFQKDYCTKVYAQVEETERVIADIKVKIDENQKRSKELQQEKVMIELVLQNPARSSVRVKMANIEAEITELKTRLGKLEQLLETRKQKLAPLIVARDNLLESLGKAREEFPLAMTEGQDVMEFGPKCPPHSTPTSKEALDLIDVSEASSACSSTRSKSASERAVDMMDEVIMMDFGKKDGLEPISKKIQLMSQLLSFEATSKPSGSGNSLILPPTSSVPKVSPHKLLPIKKIDGTAKESTTALVTASLSSASAKVPPENRDLETPQQIEEDLLMASDGELDEVASNISNEANYYVVEEELLISSDSDNEIDSVRRDRVEKSKCKASSERTVIPDGYTLSIPEDPDYTNLPLFPTSPKMAHSFGLDGGRSPGNEFRTSTISTIDIDIPEYDTESPLLLRPLTSPKKPGNDVDTPLFPNSPRRLVPECDAPKNPLMSSPSSSDSSDYLAEDEDELGFYHRRPYSDNVVDVDYPNQDKTVIPMDTSNEEDDVKVPEQNENDVDMEKDKKTPNSDVDMDSIYNTLEAMEATETSSSSSSSKTSSGSSPDDTVLDYDETLQTSTPKASDSSLSEDVENGNIQSSFKAQPEPNTEDDGRILPDSQDEKIGSTSQSQAGPSDLQEISSSEDEYAFDYTSESDSD